MLRIILIHLLCCFSFSNSLLSAKIIKADTLKEVEPYFDRLDKQSLVMWDVDMTLIFPADRILHPQNAVSFTELARHYFNALSQERSSELISRMFDRTPYDLVEAELVNRISILQKKGIPTMAFTAMQTGNFGIIDSMENWRIHQLMKVGINFSSFFPQHTGLSWKEAAYNNRSPAFMAGILCSDHLPKGPVLKKFLETIDFKPKLVIFFDDTLTSLTSVKKTLKELNIPFIGIHYHAAKKMTASIDIKIADHQFKTLVEREIWLTDAEAQLELADP